VASVKLPTKPSAEIDLTGGIRKKIADINFDLGVTYFLYPGETFARVRRSLAARRR
jgi:isopentenyl phosphate kinase